MPGALRGGQGLDVKVISREFPDDELRQHSGAARGSPVRAFADKKNKKRRLTVHCKLRVGWNLLVATKVFHHSKWQRVTRQMFESRRLDQDLRDGAEWFAAQPAFAGSRWTMPISSAPSNKPAITSAERRFNKLRCKFPASPPTAVRVGMTSHVSTTSPAPTRIDSGSRIACCLSSSKAANCCAKIAFSLRPLSVRPNVIPCPRFTSGAPKNVSSSES